jgi:hypothetical protein
MGNENTDITEWEWNMGESRKGSNDTKGIKERKQGSKG